MLRFINHEIEQLFRSLKNISDVEIRAYNVTESKKRERKEYYFLGKGGAKMKLKYIYTMWLWNTDCSAT